MYDSICHDVAKAFLDELPLTDEDKDKHAKLLAQEIQDAIEAYLSGLEDDPT
jgi:hypothetical protein